MTPCGRSVGQQDSRNASSAETKAASPASTVSARGARHLDEARPAGERERVGAGEREVAAGLVHLRRARGRARRSACVCGRRTHIPSRKVTSTAGRPATVLQRFPAAVLDGQRAAYAARGEMLHQAEEEGQVAGRDALLVERQDEGAGFRPQQEVGVLDALGDALEGGERAEIVGFEENVEVAVGDVGIDRHVRPPPRAATSAG